MKKTAIIFGALFASLSLTPANAVETKSLAIIDSYFTNASVCVATTGCNVTLASSGALSSAINHGNAMVEVAKKQNTNIEIVTIRSANASAKSVNEMNAGDFIRALTWVKNNPGNIGAVSVSRFFNGPRACTPNAAGTVEFGGVSGADAKIRSLISELAQKNIPVFAATGNKRGAAVDYPACIIETNSVGVGSKNKLGLTVSAYSFDANTDFFASSSVYSYKSPIMGLIPNTTSAGTVAVATKYLSNTLAEKFVSVVQ